MANEAATAKDAQFVLISLLPDVCLTPTKSGYPVPYTDRKFNRMRPRMARVLGLETRSAKEG